LARAKEEGNRNGLAYSSARAVALQLMDFFERCTFSFGIDDNGRPFR